MDFRAGVRGRAGAQLVGGPLRARRGQGRLLRDHGRVVPRDRPVLVGTTSAPRLPRGPPDRRRNAARHRVRDRDRRPMSVGGPSNGLLYGGLVQELAVPSGRLLWEWRSLDHVDVSETVTRPARFSVRLLPHQRYRRRRRRRSHRLGPEHVGRLQDRPPHRRGPVAARREEERLLDGPGHPVRLPARRASPRGRPDDQPVRQRPRPGRGVGRSRRAIVLGLDLRRGRSTLERELRHSPPLFAFATGSNQLLPNGNRLVTWGITGWFTEYDRDGAVCLDARLPEKGQNYRVLRFPWSGHPTAPPAFKAYRQRGTARFYASWNGATALAAWQLETGTAPGSSARAAHIRSTDSRRRFRSRRERGTPPWSRSTPPASRSADPRRSVSTSGDRGRGAFRRRRARARPPRAATRR